MIRLGIRVRAGDAEIAFARLEPVLAGGSEQIDAGETVEYALYGDDLPSDADLRALAGDTIVGLSREAVAPGWESAWHAHLERVVVGRLAVRPPWLPGEPSDLVIDPGTTFGAASHPTTRLCLELLADGARGLTHGKAPEATAAGGAPNLTLPLLLSLNLTRPPHNLIASGVLTGQADRVAPALGLVERDRREAGGWAAIVLEPA